MEATLWRVGSTTWWHVTAPSGLILCRVQGSTVSEVAGAALVELQSAHGYPPGRWEPHPVIGCYRYVEGRS